MLEQTAQIRRVMKAARRELAARTRRRSSIAVCGRIVRLATFRNALRVGAYLAHQGELDVDTLIAEAWRRGKTVYVPVMGSRRGVMRFARLDASTPLSRNRFGIREPTPGKRCWTSAASLDLVLTPLVAFDMRGNRLGNGAGYYDRCFHFLRTRGQWCKPQLVGVAYEFQRVQRIEPAPWDIPLARVATERALYG